MTGRYEVCRYCANYQKDTQKCECEDYMNCRECPMPRMIMLKDVVVRE